MNDEIEALEVALKAVQKKYGYKYLDVSIDMTLLPPFYTTINYPDGRYSYDAKGATLREALAAASADALNSEAAA
jgi:hypothetical protein